MGEEPAITSRCFETVLVVEDSDAIRELAVTILCAMNFLVLQAGNGPDAIKCAANYSGKIDLLLTDISLPGMSGLQLAKALKEFRSEIQVILMSAFTTEEVVWTSEWSFIQKPFTAQQLLDKIKTVLHPRLITPKAADRQNE